MKPLPAQEPRKTKRDAVATKAVILAAARQEFAELGVVVLVLEKRSNRI